MTEPGAVGGRSHLRVSHADREQSIEVLKSAFVQGRLTKDELDARVGQAFASRTRAELASVTADIPAEPVASPSRRAARARPLPPENASLKKSAAVITAATALMVGVWAAAVSTDIAVLGALVVTVTVTWIGVVILVGAVMLDSALQNRSGGQLPPRQTPKAGGPGSRRPAPAARARELPRIDQDPRATAEALRRRPFRPRYSAGCAAVVLYRSRRRAASRPTTVNGMEDPEVVAAIVAGDPGGIAAAYDRYAVALYSYCRSLLREPEDAADVVQDTFLIATSKLGGLRDPGKLRPWLYAVARNECLRRLRSGEATAALDEAVDTPTASADVGDAAEREDLRELIKAAIDGLNRGERDVIELSLVHELEGDELAEALGVTRNHAHALLSRARSQLERSLGALVVARTGRQACAELDAALAGWDGQMNVLVRKRVSRHIERCKICGERKRRELTPELFAGALPLVALLPGFRERVLRLCADRTLAGQVHRATVAGRAGSFGPNGFPRSVKLPGPGGWHRVLPHSHAMVAGTATAVAAVGVSAVLIISTPHHGHGPAAGPGGGTVSSASASAGAARSAPHHQTSPAPGQGPGVSSASAGPRSSLAPPAAATQPASAAGTSPGSTASGTRSSPSASAQASPSVVVQGSLVVSPSQLKLVAVTGLPTGTFTITAQGGPISNYSITGGAGQLTVSPSSGSITSGGSVTVTVTATSLIALDTKLTINPGGQTVTVLVTISL